MPQLVETLKSLSSLALFGVPALHDPVEFLRLVVRRVVQELHGFNHAAALQ
jgi:hypothetical protein